jgi:hypothetical protein
MATILHKFRRLHPILKCLTIGLTLAPLAILLFWISLKSGISLDCPGCWEKSVGFSILFSLLFLLSCFFLFDGWKKRIISVVFGASVFWFLLVLLEAQTVLLASFIDPGPILYREISHKHPEEMGVLMDTTTMHVPLRKGFVPNIKRWDKIIRLKGAKNWKGQAKP